MLSPALLLALLATACAAADATNGNSYSAHYGASAPPPAQCRVGDAVGDKGTWIDANGASTESQATRRIGASFGQPVAASALRVVMNDDAIRNLVLVEVEVEVEVEGANGAWSTLWKGGSGSAPPQGCGSVWFTHKLDSRAPVAALRLTFSQAATRIDAGNAALRKGD